MRWLILGLAGLALNASGSELLDDYVQMRTGSFTSAAQAAVDSRYDTAIWHVGEIWRGASTEVRWLYAESWLLDAEAPYAQRIWKVMETGGGIVVSGYRIGRPEAFLSAWKAEVAPPIRSEIELIALQGCDRYLARGGADRIEGGTLGNQCKNRYKGASYAISKVHMSPDELVNWDRGFDLSGNQVWGPEHGGYRFRRVGAEVCAKPATMLVYGTIEDRERIVEYGKALAQSGLYPKNRGYYIASTPAATVFEGEPPPGRGVIIARFPCLQAAKNFWYSDEYAEIRKLRIGVAKFEVLVFEDPPKPAYVDW